MVEPRGNSFLLMFQPSELGIYSFCEVWRLPRWLSGKESACQCRRCGFYPWVGKIAWSRKWQPTPVFLSGKLHGQRSLEGYSPWGHRELDTTEWLIQTHTPKWWGLHKIPEVQGFRELLGWGTHGGIRDGTLGEGTGAPPPAPHLALRTSSIWMFTWSFIVSFYRKLDRGA